MSRESRIAKKEEKAARNREESTWRGFEALIVGIITFVAIPLLLSSYGLPMIPDTISTDGLQAILDRWILAGIPIILFSIPAGYYGLGSRIRLGCCGILIILRIFWMLYLINFGDLSGIVTITDGDAWTVVDVTVTGLIALTVVFEFLRFLVDAGDYVDNRKAYLSEHGEGDEDEIRIVRVNGRYS